MKSDPISISGNGAVSFAPRSAIISANETGTILMRKLFAPQSRPICSRKSDIVLGVNTSCSIS